MLEIDKLGLDNVDRRMLEAIIRFYGGGPVGLETLAATVGEEAITLEDVCEPYLIQIGFLTRTPRGRCATKLAYEHLGPTAPSFSDHSFVGEFDHRI
jgi:Holliday junction DNA helicase RuvB